MYIDPNTGGILFQALAVFLALFSGIALLLSGKIRAAFARLKRSLRHEAPEIELEPVQPQVASSDTSDKANSPNQGN